MEVLVCIELAINASFRIALRIIKSTRSDIFNDVFVFAQKDHVQDIKVAILLAQCLVISKYKRS